MLSRTQKDNIIKFNKLSRFVVNIAIFLENVRNLF